MSPCSNGDVITFAFSCGGTGYGDPLDRDPKAVEVDLIKGVLTADTARQIYKVEWDEVQRRVSLEGTARLRAEEHSARRKRGVAYDKFEKEWLKQKPSDEILKYYGSWPDAKTIQPLLRA